MNWRGLALGLAAVLTLSTFFHPVLSLPHEVYRYLFVIDITQSMKARDYHVQGYPAERLEFAKSAVRELLHDLPCGSEVGLGLFTTQNINLLSEPIEVCEHYSVIEDVLNHIDWRMAWAGNSQVTQGIYSAVRETALKSPAIRLAFFTDGQETPPLSIHHNFNDGKPSEIKGYIVGVGGSSPVTVPRYDRENRSLGLWENRDIDTPPVASTDYSEKVDVRVLPKEGPYLSWLDEKHLLEISTTTGLIYHRLKDAESLSSALLVPEMAERRMVRTDIGSYLGFLALVLLLLIYGTDIIKRYWKVQ